MSTLLDEISRHLKDHEERDEGIMSEELEEFMNDSAFEALYKLT